MTQPARPQRSPEEMRRARDKAEADVEAAVGAVGSLARVAGNAARFAVRVAATPKKDLLRSFVKAVMSDEDESGKRSK